MFDSFTMSSRRLRDRDKDDRCIWPHIMQGAASVLVPGANTQSGYSLL